MTTGKNITLTTKTFVGQVMSLLLNMLSGFVIAYLPSRKHLLISWLKSLSTVNLYLKKIKSVSVSIVSHLSARNDGTRCHNLSFLNIDFKQFFSLSSFTFIKRVL